MCVLKGGGVHVCACECVRLCVFVCNCACVSFYSDVRESIFFYAALFVQCVFCVGEYECIFAHVCSCLLFHCVHMCARMLIVCRGQCAVVFVCKGVLLCA